MSEQDTTPIEISNAQLRWIDSLINAVDGDKPIYCQTCGKKHPSVTREKVVEQALNLFEQRMSDLMERLLRAQKARESAKN